MSDIIERAEEWLNRRDYESRAFTGTYAVISNLVAELKAARADNERLRAMVPPPKEPPPITCALCGRAGWQQFELFLDDSGVRSHRCSWRPACRERVRWPRGAKA